MEMDLDQFSASSEWSMLAKLLPNVVILGSAPVGDAVVEALTPYLRPPVQPHWTNGRVPTSGTLIVRDVQKMNLDRQLELLESCAQPGSGVQIVAIASAPLFPAVLTGRFLETLYYRLATVYVDLSDSDVAVSGSSGP